MAVAQTAAAAAAPSKAGQPARPSSSRATSQQRRQQSARKDELAAVLKEAISAVAVAPVEEEPAAEAEAHGWEQQQAVPAWDAQLAAQWGPQQAQQEPGGPSSFMQLLSCEVVMPDGEAAGFLQQDAAAAGQCSAALAPSAFVPAPAGAGFALHASPLLPTAHFDEQLPAAMAADPLAQSFSALAAGPSVVGGQGQPGTTQAGAAAAGHSTPVVRQTRCDSPPVVQGQSCLSEAEPPATDPRKPRGLLSLLQTPAEKAAPATGRAGTGGKAAKSAKPKRQAQPRKTPASAKGGTTRSGQKKKKGAAAAAAAAAAQQQQYANLPLPAGFVWAHMHPHLQQPQQQQPPQQVPVLQQQPLLQPTLLLQDTPHQAQQPPLLQQTAPGDQLAGGPGGAGPLDLGNDTLLQFLDATAAGAAVAGGMPDAAPACDGGVCHAVLLDPAATQRLIPSRLRAACSILQASQETCRCLAAPRKAASRRMVS